MATERACLNRAIFLDSKIIVHMLSQIRGDMKDERAGNDIRIIKMTD